MTKPKNPRPDGQAPKPRVVVKARILELMQPRQSYTSAGIAHSLGATRFSVWQALHRMGAAGEVWVVPVGHDNLYFKTRACASAYTKEQLAAFAAAQLAKRKESIQRAVCQVRNRVVKARPGCEPTVTIKPPEPPRMRTDRPVDYSRAKVTVCPSPTHTARWQTQPSSEAHTGFAADWAAKRGQV